MGWSLPSGRVVQRWAFRYGVVAGCSATAYVCLGGMFVVPDAWRATAFFILAGVVASAAAALVVGLGLSLSGPSARTLPVPEDDRPSISEIIDSRDSR